MGKQDGREGQEIRLGLWIKGGGARITWPVSLFTVPELSPARRGAETEPWGASEGPNLVPGLCAVSGADGGVHGENRTGETCEAPPRRACQQTGVTVVPRAQTNKLRLREAKSPIPGALLVKRRDCSFLF